MSHRETALPRYLQIAGYIRDQIAEGDLHPGDEVPSERQIAVDWNVARPTAAKALDTLRSQGLVESRRGSGTYVRSHGIAAPARDRYRRTRDSGTMYSPGENVEIFIPELISAPTHVIQALRLPTGSQAIRRQRLIGRAPLGPIELSTSWFQPGLAVTAPRLLEPKRILGGTAAYLAPITGMEATYCRDEVSARLANDDEIRYLKLVEPAAVLHYRLTICDSKDEPIQFDEAVYPPDLWVFRQEYPLS